MDLIVVNGVMGVGKSSFASKLAKELNYVKIEEEIERNFILSTLPDFLEAKKELEEIINGNPSEYELRGTLKKTYNQANRVLFNLQNYVFQSQLINLRKALYKLEENKGVIMVSHPVALYYTFVLPYYNLGWFLKEQKEYFDELVFWDYNYVDPSWIVNIYANSDIILKRINERSRKKEENLDSLVEESLREFTRFGFVECQKNFLKPQSVNLDSSYVSTEDCVKEFLRVKNAHTLN